MSEGERERERGSEIKRQRERDTHREGVRQRYLLHLTNFAYKNLITYLCLRRKK